MTTDADRLAAAGIPLRIGEREVRVRFHNRALKLLEAHYGSLEALNTQLHLLVDGGHPTPYTEMSALMLPALDHEGVTTEEFEFAFGPRDFAHLRAVLIDAVEQGFPDAPGKAVEGDQGGASPGATSTTPPPSATDAAMASSGT